MRRWSLKARMVIPVEGEPLSGAVITIEGDRIAGIGKTGQADIDLGDVAVVPGLVNAHAHLDLSDCERPLDMNGSFADWIGRVIRHRNRDGADPAAAIQKGTREILETATTLVGDINSIADSRLELEKSPIDAVVYRELIGVDSRRAETSWSEFKNWISAKNVGEKVLPGVSPHAPYSTRFDLIQRAGVSGLRAQIHLGETPEELEFLANRSGPLAELLARLGLDGTKELANSFGSVLKALPQATIVHANVLPAVEFVNRGRSVIHCPATHRQFGRALFPANRLLSAGVNVGFGTDGRASSPNLNLGEHVANLMTGPESLSPLEILRCATSGGAKALALDEFHGSITIGKIANLAVVPFAKGIDRWEEVIDGLAKPRAVLWRGTWRDIAGMCKPA